METVLMFGFGGVVFSCVAWFVIDWVRGKDDYW